MEGVVPFLQTIDSPVVVCNIDDSDEPDLQGLYTSTVVISKYDRRIGVIGVILQTTNVSLYLSTHKSSHNSVRLDGKYQLTTHPHLPADTGQHGQVAVLRRDGVGARGGSQIKGRRCRHNHRPVALWPGC